MKCVYVIDDFNIFVHFNHTFSDQLWLYGNQLTDVTGLENLTQLKSLYLEDNLDLTKAQIDQLQKALPKCKIISNPKK